MTGGVGQQPSRKMEEREVPARSIQPRVIYANIVRDFEAAWNGIAASPRGDTGLGNFLFGFTGTLP
ncbi:MAG: hypothetical protein Q8O86_00535 [Dehalococcoidia bacterium]|nr:hypothetical protein [Dehalococcoidia bacterium]